LDKKSGQFSIYKDNPYDKVRLSSDIVYSIFEDKSGILWIGTAGDGVNKLDFRKLQFVNYSYQPDNQKSLSNNKIYSLVEDDKGIIWIGTYGGGLNKFDPNNKKNEFERFIHDDKDKNSLKDNGVYCTVKDNNGILWIGMQTGLDFFDTRREKFIRTKNFPVLPGTPGPAVFSLAQTSASEI
jgi:ligand-binding sensor domain-containing protein